MRARRQRVAASLRATASGVWKNAIANAVVPPERARTSERRR
jgi:hypothetical protein